MERKELLKYLKGRVSEVLAQKTENDVQAWHEFLSMHPADIAEFLTDLNDEDTVSFFRALPHALEAAVFEHFSLFTKGTLLRSLDENRLVSLLQTIPADELTDLFDELSDDELKKYLKLLHKQEREKVLSLMKFNPESAGGIMDTDVFTLTKDFTVGKSIQILQRLQPQYDLHRFIYVTDRTQKLVGFIRLEDLVLEKSDVRLSKILRKNELVAHADQDREEVAQQMVHYKLTIVPVVDRNNTFLGVISAKTLVEIIEQEASEDLYRISALVPIKEPYFEAPFMKLLYERSSILIILFLAQSLSQIIMEANSELLGEFLVFFVPALSSTGGNTSGQTSALVIQGLASGDIKPYNVARFLTREFMMALAIASIMAVFAFGRVFILYRRFWESIAISSSLFFIVLVAVVLGSAIPLLLKRFNIDPAFSAGPFLATIMDVLGIFIFCSLTQILLKTIL